MSERILKIEEVNKAIFEVGEDLRTGRLHDIEMHSLDRCILAYAAEKLGMSRIAELHWESHGLDEKDRKRLYKLGFKYVTAIGSILDCRAFRVWHTKRAINRYLTGKKRVWL